MNNRLPPHWKVPEDPVTNFTIPSAQWSEDATRAYSAGADDMRRKVHQRLAIFRARMQQSRSDALKRAYDSGWAWGFLLGGCLGIVLSLVFRWWGC